MDPDTRKSAIGFFRQLSIRGESSNHDSRSHGDFNCFGLPTLVHDVFVGWPSVRREGGFPEKHPFTAPQ